MAQGTLAGTSIANDTCAFGTAGESRVQQAMQHVKDVRAAALIQFHPGIAEARADLYGNALEVSPSKTAG